MLPEAWLQVKRLLVGQMGDGQAVAAIEPALVRLHQTLPQTEITLLTAPEGQAVGACWPWVKHHLVWQPTDSPLLLVHRLASSGFEASIIFTQPGESPYPLAYLCYLAGIPLRLGQSWEFGGGVLSPAVQPPIALEEDRDRHLHLLEAINFPG